MKKMKGASRPKNARRTLFRFLSYLRPHALLFALCVLCLVVSALSTVLLSYAIKPVINDFILPMLKTSSHNFLPLVVFLLKLLGVLTGGCFASWAASRLQLHISTSIIHSLRTSLFKSIQALPISTHDHTLHGDFMSRFTSDTDAVQDMLSMTLPQVLTTTVAVPTTLGVMIFLSPILTFSLIGLLAICAFIVAFLTKLSVKSFRLQQDAIGALNGFSDEILNGEDVVHTFLHERQVVNDFDGLNATLQKSATRATIFASLAGPLTNNYSHFAQALLAIFGGVLTVMGRLDLGSFASFLQYTNSFSHNISSVAQLFNSLLNAVAALERIFLVIDAKSEANSGNHTLVNAYTLSSNGRLVQSFARTGSWAWKDDVTHSLRPLNGKIEFRNVTFSYEEGKCVLKNLSFTVKSGEALAIVGATGLGKSTITNLLLRFYDLSPSDSGEIIIDGVPIKKIAKSSLRRAVSIVLQDSLLFSGTILDNIKCANPDAAFAQVVQAATAAGANSFISALPDGYNTIIDSKNCPFSVAQVQLISIARAILKDAPILILDEATSCIDDLTQSLVQNALKPLIAKKTVILIAHKKSALTIATNVLDLEGAMSEKSCE